MAKVFRINQIEWIKLMNNYKNNTEEIILKENIYNFKFMH